MPAAPKPVVLLIKAKLSSKLFKAHVITFYVIYNKVPYATFKAIFIDNFTNSASKVFVTVAALDLWQAEQKRTKFPFIVKKVYGKAEERGKLTGRPHVKGDINSAK
jgi:hypothetical protein